MTIDDLVIEAHGCAVSKGWWDKDRTPLEIHALVHSEVSEATQAVRKGKSETEELADVVLRIADYFGRNNWDLTVALQQKMAKNRLRSYRHGGKLA